MLARRSLDMDLELLKKHVHRIPVNDGSKVPKIKMVEKNNSTHRVQKLFDLMQEELKQSWRKWRGEDHS